MFFNITNSSPTLKIVGEECKKENSEEEKGEREKKLRSKTQCHIKKTFFNNSFGSHLSHGCN